MRGVDLRHHHLGGFVLRIVMAEDDAAVLRPDVVALAVLRRWIVDGKEYPQQIGVGNVVRVEGDPHHFGMPRAAGANLLVARVRHVPAGIARNHAADTTQPEKDGLQAPEAAAAQGRQFLSRHLALLPLAASGGVVRRVFQAWGEAWRAT